MEIEHIKNSILEIRGKKVILDFELAKMYQTETKRLKESVKRNARRFLAFAKLQRSKAVDFMFELTQEEWTHLRSQIATSSGGGQIIENRLIENSMTKKFPPQRREFT